MRKDFNVITIISGRGSNFKALLDTCKYCTFKALLSNKKNAPGLEFAKEKNIPTFVFKKSDYQDFETQKKALFKKVVELEPDLVALAGYMQIVPAEYTKILFGKLVNIHPSLLPKYKGLDTHKQALESGDKFHGCSVHLVTPELDEGPIIAQAQVPINEGDTEELLAKRVLEQEHKLYPWVIDMIASQEIVITGSKISYSKLARNNASSFEFLLSNLN
ncbi:MAG: phosphoribosylglycinamide formyltransferase [Bdellovibrionales bacterium]|nr:phosphoribosylglycinamide formyltransferase [Bdellovibrionales bacterium]